MKTADLERSKRLKELGWKQDGYWWNVNSSWNYTEDGCIEWLDDGKWNLCSHTPQTYHSIKSDDKWDKPDSWDKHFEFERKRLPEIEKANAPTASEMIEWLLGEDYKVTFNGKSVRIYWFGGETEFSTEQGNENALADAVIWVLEKQR